jgi:hypothetical protein
LVSKRLDSNLRKNLDGTKKKGDIQYYLNKPFDFDRLKEVIKGIVSNKNGTTNNPAY